MLLEIRSKTGHHWLSLDLRGAAPNVFAYGARATGYAGKDLWTAEVSPASSYLSSSDPRIHRGLGPFKRLDKLVIRWPSGDTQSFENVAGEQFLKITEGRPIEPQPSGVPAKAPH